MGPREESRASFNSAILSHWGQTVMGSSTPTDGDRAGPGPENMLPSVYHGRDWEAVRFLQKPDLPGLSKWSRMGGRRAQSKCVSWQKLQVGTRCIPPTWTRRSDGVQGPTATHPGTTHTVIEAMRPALARSPFNRFFERLRGAASVRSLDVALTMVSCVPFNWASSGLGLIPMSTSIGLSIGLFKCVLELAVEFVQVCSPVRPLPWAFPFPWPFFERGRFRELGAPEHLTCRLRQEVQGTRPSHKVLQIPHSTQGVGVSLLP